MRGALVGLGLLLTCGFASLGCSSLLGLDDFSAAPASGGAGGAVGGSAGASGAGPMGGSAGTVGGSAGAGGAADDGCQRIYADANGFDPFRGPSAAVYTIPLSTNLDGELQDRIRILAYAPKVGSYALSEATRQQRSTCKECVWIDTDVSEDKQVTGGFFMVESGTLILDTVSDIANAPHKGALSDVRFVESKIDPDVGTSAPVENGRCLRLVQAAWNFVEFNYEPTTISAIRSGAVPEWSRVTINTASVSALGQGSFWLQRGGGQKSGVLVSFSPAGVDIGDLISVRGVVRKYDVSGPLYINASDSWEGIQSNAKGQGELDVRTVTTVDDDTLEAALVRVAGPLTVVENNSQPTAPGLGPIVLEAGDGSRVATSTLLFDPTVDPAFPNFAVGDSVGSVVGVVSFNSASGEQELIPRAASDWEGYQSAQ